MDTKIQNYIKLVYSEKSEFNKISDLEERKKMACEKAKVDYAASTDILHMKDTVVNEKIFEFLRQQNSNEFVLLISDQHLFWEIMQRQMKPLTDTEDKDTVMKDLELKTRISKEAQALLDRIKSRYISIFQGDAEIKIAETRMKMIKPEDRLKEKGRKSV